MSGQLIKFNDDIISLQHQTFTLQYSKRTKRYAAKNGFRVLNQCEIDGSKFVESKSDHIMTIAEKL